MSLMGIGPAMSQSDPSQAWWAQTPDASVWGCGMDRVGEWIASQGLKPRRQVTVAVIDGSFDMSHEYLRPLQWQNPKEKPDGLDNDRNGLVDDVEGWNFLAGKDGEQILKTGTEEYRQWKRLHLKEKGGQPLTAAEKALFEEMEKKVHMNSYIFYARNLEAIWNHVAKVDSAVHVCFGSKDIPVRELLHLELEDTTGLTEPLQTTMMRLLTVSGDTKWSTFVESQRQESALAVKRLHSLETDDDAHRRVGNDPDDFSSLAYGSPQLSAGADDAYHATMVSGLVVQAARMAQAPVSLLPLRAVPDGDEYDRDITAALRYAVDHGAKVVNMSFGKTFSDHRDQVDRALDYAACHDVLLVLASGNHGKDNDVVTIYPCPQDTLGQRRAHMLVVGAHDQSGHRAAFSNYGPGRVDILAPGTELYSTAPGNHWSVAQGTSLAAPIVSGLAAALRAYFPKLSAAQVRDILMLSSTRMDDTGVKAGVLDAARAFDLALKCQRGTVRIGRQ